MAGLDSFNDIYNWGLGGASTLGDWMGQGASAAGGWAKDNPMQALSLGIGAAGTGMGIYDQMQANKRIEQQNKAYAERQRLAEQLSRMGPQGFAPNLTGEQVQAYMRPWMGTAAQQGLDPSGGAWRQAGADAAAKLELERLGLGNQIYQSRLGALGYGTPDRMQQPAQGNVGGLGSALQNIMLMQALARRGTQQPSQPGAAYTGGMTGTSDWLRDQSIYPVSSMDLSIPQYNYGAFKQPQINWPQANPTETGPYDMYQMQEMY